MQVLLKKIRFVSFLLLAVSFMVPAAHCQAPQGGGAASSTAGVDKSYRLQIGDKLNVKIYPEDEYLKGGDVEISSEGNITLPLVGKISIANETVIEAEKIVADVLAKDYLVNPQVVIEVLEYQASKFVVLGEVVRPGTYEFPAGSTSITLLYAISIGGGFSELANIKKIKIMRKSTGEVLRVNAEDIIGGKTSDIEIKADDVIHVSESFF